MFRLRAGAAALADRATPSSRQDVRPSSVEPRPAGAVPSQGQPCPAAPRPGHPLPSPCSLLRNRAHCFGTLGSRRPFAPAAEVSLLPSTRGRARGTGGIEQRRVGHQEVGAGNARRESRGRAALPGLPRGLGRAQGERRAAAQGGRAVRGAAGAPPLSQICARRAAGGLAGHVRSAPPRAVPGTRVSVRARVLCASRPDARLQAVRAGGSRLGACSPGRLENLPKRREEAAQVFGSRSHAGRVAPPGSCTAVGEGRGEDVSAAG